MLKKDHWAGDSCCPEVHSGVSVLIDEAYHDSVTPTGTYASASRAARAAANQQLIVTRTFSKVYGLAGPRVGYAISSTETGKRLAEASCHGCECRCGACGACRAQRPR